MPSDRRGTSPSRPGRPWVVAQHAPHEGPGLLAEVLDAAGVDTRVVRLDRGDALPAPDELGGLVVMGGAMGVHDIDEFPWLEAERRWIADAVGSDVPVLGVCLGAQQLAAALGASVTTGPAPEVGVGDVELTAEGRADPVLGPEGDRVPVVHWHGDTFEIPHGAVHLAAGDRYPNQAFRFGRLAYGLQFHIEVDDAMAAAWAPELPAGVTLPDAGAPGGGGDGPAGAATLRRGGPDAAESGEARSDPAEVVVGLLGHPRTGRAVPARLEGGAARAVVRALHLAPGVARSPAAEQTQGPGQVAPGLGDAVLDAWRPVRIARSRPRAPGPPGVAGGR